MPPNNPQSTPSNADSSGKDDDALFTVPPPPEPEPLSKGKLALIIGFTFLGILLVVAAVLASLAMAANQAAYNYDKLASENLARVDLAIKDLRPSSVLNRRDVVSPRAEIKKTQQNQADLSEILLGTVLSSSYSNAHKLSAGLGNYYESVLTFTNDMDDLVAFSDGVQAVVDQESQLVKLTNVGSSISLRSTSGSISSDASHVKNLRASSDLDSVKQKLINAINQKAKAYQDWAIALEKHKPTKIKMIKKQIVQANQTINVVANDIEYAKAFSNRYAALQKEQLSLKRQAAL